MVRKMSRRLGRVNMESNILIFRRIVGAKAKGNTPSPPFTNLYTNAKFHLQAGKLRHTRAYSPFNTRANAAAWRMNPRSVGCDPSIVASPSSPSNSSEIGRAVQQECRDRSRMPSSA
eukprot:TRINITY_DN43263_c0_g1_i1.p1 TRINITY_DN43263_c0_g1~~TRINITY_DN43263_c0_g1_i1.p1  ORF type:complete len:117 (-),score=12.88 TRINITY_DN43263_c0_g1_i1:10-360(-)